MTTFTFFDLVSAIRQIRQLHFSQPSEDLIATPTTVKNISRDSRTWEITTGTGKVFNWFEGNLPPLVLSEVVDSPIRSALRFNYMDVLANIRSKRTLRFTTGGSVVLAIPTGIINHSRNSSVYEIVTASGSFSWADDNSGPTVITEV